MRNFEAKGESIKKEAASNGACSPWLYALSPVIFLPCFVLCVSYIVMWTKCLSNPFASFTNVAFIAVGFQRIVIMFLQEEVFVQTLGCTVASPFLYIILGASSMSFHLTSELNSPEHYFDLLHAKFLVTHVTYVAFAVNVYWFVMSFAPRFSRVAVVVLSILYTSGFTLLIIFYEEVHAHQDAFYLSTSLVAASFFVALMYKLVTVSLLSYRSALLEVLAVSSCVFCAIVSQCELMGRRYEEGSSEYDFYHGNWHFLLAIGTSIVYSRCSDVTTIVYWERTRRRDVQRCRAHAIDTVGLSGLTLYSGLLFVLKETSASLTLTKAVLASVAFSLGLYSVTVCMLIAVSQRSVGDASLQA